MSYTLLLESTLSGCMHMQTRLRLLPAAWCILTIDWFMLTVATRTHLYSLQKMLSNRSQGITTVVIAICSSVLLYHLNLAIMGSPWKQGKPTCSLAVVKLKQIQYIDLCTYHFPADFFGVLLPSPHDVIGTICIRIYCMDDARWLTTLYQHADDVTESQLSWCEGIAIICETPQSSWPWPCRNATLKQELYSDSAAAKTKNLDTDRDRVDRRRRLVVVNSPQYQTRNPLVSQVTCFLLHESWSTVRYWVY